MTTFYAMTKNKRKNLSTSRIFIQSNVDRCFCGWCWSWAIPRLRVWFRWCSSITVRTIYLWRARTAASGTYSASSLEDRSRTSRYGPNSSVFSSWNFNIF